MIKKLDNLDFETIEKNLNIWLNSNLEAHDFIKREYWIDNLDKVKKMFSDSTIYVYYADNQIVGFADLYEQYIAGLFITDNYRNKGIGRFLLERLKSDYNVLNLYVNEKNEGAIRFYTKHQFEIRSKEFEVETQEYEYFMKWDSN
ncbi:GNAT family N-acetyltransferase [Staphylococcus haemolyticus]|uniref:GNAT family N-acetyltransferase n=1 Tax=Staphylococcus haemolyticus TaxID=1283 RepID=UPI0028A2E936|nr:GNAT family N-acetyltransferase [Staphylococcus haemolyticus]MDT4198622.1 GNAT family N-acetyltransferase [Staphylococcus haemolyticus]MDT4269323.1 GNAT family N-acetyltransferase [Staphylococcus haemolyticus]MDT4271801.1 GNAT family N-acetyltransferase [Staphylococcus haemolyticus]